MKPDQLLQELKNVSERLSFTVQEQSFRQSGVKVKSGWCIVNDQRKIIMDKNKSIKEKTQILASILKEFPLDEIYMIPAVREFINDYDDE